MLSRLREHFGTAGLVVAIVALVAALAGGAVAATGGSGDGKASASAAKGKPGPRGKPGKPGKPGPAGPQGPAGPAGPKGDTGAAGSNGSNGSNGATGPTGPTGKAGKDGVDGVDGETGFTEALPSGKTETGVWDIAPLAAGGLPGTARVETDLSFAIPLASEIPAANVHFEPKGGFVGQDAVSCPGSAAQPSAANGHVCAYIAFSETFGKSEAEYEEPMIVKLTNQLIDEGASKPGAILRMLVAPETTMRGSWAVTAL